MKNGGASHQDGPTRTIKGSEFASSEHEHVDAYIICIQSTSCIYHLSPLDVLTSAKAVRSRGSRFCQDVCSRNAAYGGNRAFVS